MVGFLLVTERSSATEQEDQPFELPVSQMWSQVIPDGLGMKFFEGHWEYIGRGGMIPIDVTAEAFVNLLKDESSPYRNSPYRVLYEARNYVLIAELLRDTDSAWTNFVVLTLRSRSLDDPYINMIYFYCGDPFMKDADKAFHWPKAKLMELFRSQCPVEVDLKKHSRLGEGWTWARYQRREE